MIDRQIRSLIISIHPPRVGWDFARWALSR